MEGVATPRKACGSHRTDVRAIGVKLGTTIVAPSRAPKRYFIEPDQRDLGRPVPPRKNISIVPSGKSSLELRAVPSRHEGRLAIVTDVRRDAVDASSALDERR